MSSRRQASASFERPIFLRYFYATKFSPAAAILSNVSAATCQWPQTRGRLQVGERETAAACASVDIDLPSVSAFDAEKKGASRPGFLTFADIAPAVHRLFIPTSESHLFLSREREIPPSRGSLSSNSRDSRARSKRGLARYTKYIEQYATITHRWKHKRLYSFSRMIWKCLGISVSNNRWDLGDKIAWKQGFVLELAVKKKR